MASSPYYFDLLQLSEDHGCLLTTADDDVLKPGTDKNLNDSLYDLSESTLAAMQLLNDTTTSSGANGNLTPPTPPIPSTEIPNSTVENSYLSDMAQLNDDRSSLSTIKTSSDSPTATAKMPQSPAGDGLERLAITPLHKLIPAIPSVKRPVSQATALATRTTEDVISDLKRPLRVSHESPEKRRRSSVSSSLVADSNFNHVDGAAGRAKGDIDDSADGSEFDDEEDEEDEVIQTSKPRKITERQRRYKAIAENHIQDVVQRSFNKAAIVKPQANATQSAKWLVNQSESHQIISTPREYQTELFERAKENNIIAVLDTGSGKTLIAVLLLRHVMAQELENRAAGMPKRISFFLVDSVTLVYQQHAVLKANLDQPMEMFYGDMGCDLWKREKWEEHFSKTMVIVCTAEILRQCLHRSFITISRINLLIFDEAHHAKKDHAYARIIKDFYMQTPSNLLRPKIFGMTASPVDAKTDVRKAAAELEGLLNCRIATADDPSLGGFKVTSKQELLGKYAPLGPEIETPLYQQMKERFDTNGLFQKPLNFARQASRELGPWCSDQVWPLCLTKDESLKLLAKTERYYHAKKVQEPLRALEKRKVNLHEARDIVNSHRFEAPHFDPNSEASSNLSSKVVLLISYLRDRFERPTEDKAIVFVRQRYTAQLLAQLFRHPDIQTPHLKVGTLVGTRSGDAGDLNVSFREQVLTMMRFRNGDINCLFATSVAEEGLDIPDCNLVIRFDLYTTLIQYVQSRGRARHINSRYIHMCEDQNQDHAQIIREVHLNENILETFCRALPADRKMNGGDYDIDHYLKMERSHRVYTVPDTGAKLTYKVSLMVLANFVDSLGNGKDHVNPDYIITVQNRQFICEVILPESSPVRSAIGRPASTKQVAKCSAAFEACVLLRQGKYLDEWLLPIFTKKLPAMRNALLPVSKKQEAYKMRTKPDMWSVGSFPEELFLTILILQSPEVLGRPSQPLALLTRSPLPQLPSFYLHFGDGKHSQFHSIPVSMALRVDEFTLRSINLFTLCIFEDVFSKRYESDERKMPYFLAPLKFHGSVAGSSNPSDLIAWDILKDIDEYTSKWGDQPWEYKPWKNAPDEFFKDKFVVDPWDGSRKLWTVGVAHQYKPLDPVPPNSAPRKGTRQNNDNIMEYSCSLWAKAREKRTFEADQPVIEARFISLRRNLLDEFDASEVETPKGCFVIMEPLKMSPLPTPVVAMAYVFPAVIHRIESYLIALDACTLLHLNIRPDLALEAVTKDSDNTDDHGSEQINFQRGMGNNYERLEFLGDCFLKMATSISLYSLRPEDNEFEYHVGRMLMICNKNLRDNAIKLKIYEYIRSMSFNRRAWYPEGLNLIKGKKVKAPDSHRLGDKSIADVCEALIGAALLTCHEKGDMDNAVRAVTELVSSENHKVFSWAEYYKLYKVPKWQAAPSTAAQRDLARQVEGKHAYHFKWPRLVRSAFIHPSYPFSYEKIPSYQRLEFLGDSLLDMACINFLFHTFPDRDPQWLTEHKMAMVSNQFLGALCVALGFHCHLLIFNAKFSRQITDYVVDISEARFQAEEDAVRAGKTRKDCSPDYWTSVRQPPKCLPDIVEAYVGAVFVDSGYNYQEVQRFFDEHIKWYFLDMSIYDTFANKHPTTFLTKFLQIQMGCMDWNITHQGLPNIDGSKPQVMAVVMVHSQVISDHTAESSRYAKVGAAKKALEILEGLPLPEFREKYGCGCREDDEASEVASENLHGTAV